MPGADRYVDTVIACADLVTRTGAANFEIGYRRDDVPVEDAGWYAVAEYRGARVITEEHRSPSTAAQALSEQLLSGAVCKCGRPVRLDGDPDDPGGCRWQIMGKRWQSTCDAPPVRVRGDRGDLAAMHAAARERDIYAPDREQRRTNRPDRRHQT